MDPGDRNREQLVERVPEQRAAGRVRRKDPTCGRVEDERRLADLLEESLEAEVVRRHVYLVCAA